MCENTSSLKSITCMIVILSYNSYLSKHLFIIYKIRNLTTTLNYLFMAPTVTLFVYIYIYIYIYVCIHTHTHIIIHFLYIMLSYTYTLVVTIANRMKSNILNTYIYIPVNFITWKNNNLYNGLKYI